MESIIFRNGTYELKGRFLRPHGKDDDLARMLPYHLPMVSNPTMRHNVIEYLAGLLPTENIRSRLLMYLALHVTPMVYRIKTFAIIHGCEDARGSLFRIMETLLGSRCRNIETLFTTPLHETDSIFVTEFPADFVGLHEDAVEKSRRLLTVGTSVFPENEIPRSCYDHMFLFDLSPEVKPPSQEIFADWCGELMLMLLYISQGGD